MKLRRSPRTPFESIVIGVPTAKVMSSLGSHETVMSSSLVAIAFAATVRSVAEGVCSSEKSSATVVSAAKSTRAPSGCVGAEVGAVVGAEDGVEVGTDVGAEVGTGVVGVEVGAEVGTLVGDEVGIGVVGVEVGVEVGTEVGTLVGDEVGYVVGDEVGTLVGVEVGAEVGTTVGAAVGAEVGDTQPPTKNALYATVTSACVIAPE